MSEALVLNRTKFVPSPQQAGFFDWITNGTGSCVLEAVAGSGKTTTLIRALKLMSGTKFFGAFNKKIAVEIENKAGRQDGLTVSTMHAAGLAAWKSAVRYPQVEADKVRNIYRAAILRNMQYAPFQTTVVKLVELAKQAGLGIEGFPSMKSKAAWLALIDHYDLETFDEASGVDNTDLIVKLALKTLEASIAQNFELIDFADMIYAPLYHGCTFSQYDWVLVDEAQDTNATRRALALRMLAEGGRLVAVGDRHQAIYGFTGADSDALDLIGDAVNAARLPLTTTFRCPKSVVKYAQQWVSHIHAADSAPEGIVREIGNDALYTEAAVGDAVLCRLNAPLVEVVYKFIANGVPAKIEGREIGKGLIALARRWKVKSLTALVDRLGTYTEREIKKFMTKEQPLKAQAVEDKSKCLKVIIDRVSSKNPDTKKPVDDVVAEIESIFNDDNDSSKVVVLSSIHKSKGREWRKVIWLQTPMSRFAKLDWQKQQEANLCYVAATRAMHELVLTDAPVPAKKEV